MSKPVSWLTQPELDAVQHLHQRAPYQIQFVCDGYFSVARHYGGMAYNGSHFVYFPDCDSLVRDDVVKLVTKMRKKAKQSPAAEAVTADLWAQEAPKP